MQGFYKITYTSLILKSLSYYKQMFYCIWLYYFEVTVIWCYQYKQIAHPVL